MNWALIALSPEFAAESLILFDLIASRDSTRRTCSKRDIDIAFMMDRHVGMLNASKGTQSCPAKELHTDNVGDENMFRKPIAVCGVGIRLPGGICNTSDFWSSLANEDGAQSSRQNARNDANGYTNGHTNGFDHDSGVEGDIAKHSCGLDEDVASLDATFFSMDKDEAANLGRHERMLLEVAWECLEDAAELNYRGDEARVGCYVGMAGKDSLEMTATDRMMATRVSCEYGLCGPRCVLLGCCRLD